MECTRVVSRTSFNIRYLCPQNFRKKCCRTECKRNANATTKSEEKNCWKKTPKSTDCVYETKQFASANRWHRLVCIESWISETWFVSHWITKTKASRHKENFNVMFRVGMKMFWVLSVNSIVFLFISFRDEKKN